MDRLIEINCKYKWFNYVEEWHVEDHEVEWHWQADSQHQPDVNPGWHHDEWLVLWQTVHGVQHLNGDQDRQGHGHWVWITEDIAVNVSPFGTAGSALKVVSLKISLKTNH